MSIMGLQVAQAVADAKLQAQVDALGPWFGAYDFGLGITTPLVEPRDDAAYFQDRAARVFGALADAGYGPNGGPPGRGPVLLDVGCSDGYFTAGAWRLGYVAAGVDVRRASVERARWAAAYFFGDAKGLAPQFHVGDARLAGRPLVAVGGADVVLCQGLFYHMTDPISLFHNVAGMLRPGGAAVFAGYVTGAGVLTLDVFHEDPADPRSGTTRIVLRPSEGALACMMEDAGFRFWQLPPGPRHGECWREYLAVVR